jgi:hypothetical protein
MPPSFALQSLISKEQWYHKCRYKKTEPIECLEGMRLDYGTGNQNPIGLDFLISLLAEREARITLRSSHPRDYFSKRVAREDAESRGF